MKIRDTALSVLLILLIALAVLSLFVHSLTYFGYDPREFSLRLWYGLQFSSAFTLIPPVIYVGRIKTDGPLRPVYLIDNVLGFCFVVFVLYAFFNFPFTSTVLLHDASPQIVNGFYGRGSHGFFTMVSKEEFMREMVYEARMHSGHWMACYLFASAALRRKMRMLSGDYLPEPRSVLPKAPFVTVNQVAVGLDENASDPRPSGKMLRWINLKIWARISGFLVGLTFLSPVLVLLLKSTAPVLLCFIAIGFWFCVGIMLEWVESNSRALRKPGKSQRELAILAFGSVPYAAGLVLMGAFVFYSFRVLLGNYNPPPASLGRVIVYSFAAMFIVSAVLGIISLVRNTFKGAGK